MLAKKIMRLLFDQTDNLTGGFHVKRPDGSMRPFHARFKGFLADEKGLKEFYCLKGASGFKCCPSCLNVTNRVKLPDDSPAVGVDCPSRGRFQRCTDRLFYGMLESLDKTRAAGNIRKLVELEIDYGIKHDRHSLFLDDRLKPILSPMDNYFRDAQHTLFSGGVAESEMAGVVTEMKRHGKTLDDLARYSEDYTFPKNQTKIDPRWFGANMFSAFGTKHFAGDMLSMIFLLAAFLQDEIAPGLMDNHIECFMLLVRITVIVMSAGDATESIIAELTIAVDRHARLYCQLYLDPKMYKVKWHHLMHLPDDILRLGKFMSCFPMERKHKSIKVHMVNSFARIEETTVYNHLNAMITSIIRGDTQFRTSYMLSPVDGRSSRAVLPCGTLIKGDMVMFNSDDHGQRALGEIQGFVQVLDSPLLVHVSALAPCSRAGHRWWNSKRPQDTIIDSRRVIRAVAYKLASDHRIRIIEAML